MWDTHFLKFSSTIFFRAYKNQSATSAMYNKQD